MYFNECMNIRVWWEQLLSLEFQGRSVIWPLFGFWWTTIRHTRNEYLLLGKIFCFHIHLASEEAIVSCYLAVSLIYLKRWDGVVDFITVSSPFHVCFLVTHRAVWGGERERIFTHWTTSLVMWLLGSDKWVGYTVLRSISKSPPLLSQLFFSSAVKSGISQRVAIPLTRMRKICAEELQPTCNLTKKETFGFLCQWNLAAVIAAKSRENYWNIPYLVVYAR